MKRRVCLIHPYPSPYLLRCLVEGGFDVVLVTAPGTQLPDVGCGRVLDVPLHDEALVFAALAREHAARPFDLIVPFHEGTTGLAARVATRLGLPGNPVAAADASRNKHRAYEAWVRAGVPVPRTVPVKDSEGWRLVERELGYPCVIKLADSMNSQGVGLVRSRAEFVSYHSRLRALLDRPVSLDLLDDRNRMAYGRGEVKIIAQEFCPGVEVGVDLLYRDGVVITLGVFEKAPAHGPTFAETMSISPTSLGEAGEAELASIAGRAVAALGGTCGAAHVEIRLGHDGPRVLEAGLRPGGGYTMQAIERMTGINVPVTMANVLAGDSLPAPPTRRGATLYGGIVYPTSGILRRATGLEVLESTPGVIAYSVLHRPGDRVYALPESAQPHFVYYLVEAKDRVEALARHGRIQQAITIEVAPLPGDGAGAAGARGAKRQRLGGAAL